MSNPTDKDTLVHIVKELEYLGICKGQVLYVSASFASLLSASFKAKNLLDALIELLGDEGTLIMPTYTQKQPLWMVYLKLTKYIYNVNTTQSTTGLLPELLRVKKGSYRSSHPTNSIVSYGKLANKFCSKHNIDSGAYEPFKWISEYGGKFLFIGLNDSFPGLRHQVQDQAGLLTLINHWQGVRYYNGKSMLIFHRKDVGGCTTNSNIMYKILKNKSMVNKGKLIGLESNLLDAKSTLKILANDMIDNLDKYLCCDRYCSWCRIIERRKHITHNRKHKNSFFCKKLLNFGYSYSIKKMPFSRSVKFFIIELCESKKLHKHINCND